MQDGVEFGPIQNRDGKVVAFGLIFSELPGFLELLFDDTFGPASIDDEECQFWNLKEPVEIEDAQWLVGAIQSEAVERLNFNNLADWSGDHEFAEALKGKGNKIECDFRRPEIAELVSRYRARKAAETPRKPLEAKGHQRLMNCAWEAVRADERLKPVDRMTFFVILKFCWSKHWCEEWESVLADYVGCDVRTFQRSLRTLVDCQWISVDHHHRQKSRYHVLKKNLIPPYPTKTK